MLYADTEPLSTTLDLIRISLPILGTILYKSPVALAVALFWLLLIIQFKLLADHS